MEYVETIITTEGEVFARRVRETANVLSGPPAEIDFYRTVAREKEAVTLAWRNAGPMRVEWVPSGDSALVNVMLIEEEKEPVPLMVALLLSSGALTIGNQAEEELREWQKHYATAAERDLKNELQNAVGNDKPGLPVLVTLSAYWNLQEQPDAFYMDERYLSALANLFGSAFFEQVRGNPESTATSE